MSEKTGNYHVLRLAKRAKKDWATFLAHSTRLHTPKNIQADRMHENMHFIGLNDDNQPKQTDHTPLKLQALVKQRAKKLVEQRVEKLRSNAVYATEMIISASPEAMNTMTKEQQIQYLKDGIQLLIEKFGADNFISAHFHFDETTPHAHVFMSCVTKNAKGKYSTNFKAFIDGPTELGKFQDEFYKNIGIRYGLDEHNKKERAWHTELTQFSGLVKKYGTKSRTANLHELEKMISETYAKNAIETHKDNFDAVSSVLYGIMGKTHENASHEELEVLREVLTEKTIEPLRLRFERKIKKRVEKRQTEEEQKAKETHDAEIAYQRIKPFEKHYRNAAEEYAKYIGTRLEQANYAPYCKITQPTGNDNLVALQERLDQIQKELEHFYNDDDVGIRLKQNVSRMLSMPNLENDRKRIEMLVRQPYLSDKTGQFTNIREWIVNNPEKAMNTITSYGSAKHIVNLIIKEVKDFISQFRPQIQRLKAAIRQERHYDYERSLKAINHIEDTPNTTQYITNNRPRMR